MWEEIGKFPIYFIKRHGRVIPFSLQMYMKMGKSLFVHEMNTSISIGYIISGDECMDDFKISNIDSNHYYYVAMSCLMHSLFFQHSVKLILQFAFI